MIILECEQNSPEWDAARLGTPSASCFKEIITASGAPSKSRSKYMYKLAGERVTGEKRESHYSADMALGHEREDDSRRLYELVNRVKVKQVGFCYKDEQRLYGASPDGLVCDDGGFETKNANSTLQAERLHKGWNGSEHHRQVMGCLLICDRKWWDLVSYCRGMRPVTVRFERDDAFLRTLEVEVLLFCEELSEMVEKINGGV